MLITSYEWAKPDNEEVSMNVPKDVSALSITFSHDFCAIYNNPSQCNENINQDFTSIF